MSACNSLYYSCNGLLDVDYYRILLIFLICYGEIKWRVELLVFYYYGQTMDVVSAWSIVYPRVNSCISGALRRHLVDNCIHCIIIINWYWIVINGRPKYYVCRELDYYFSMDTDMFCLCTVYSFFDLDDRQSTRAPVHSRTSPTRLQTSIGVTLGYRLSMRTYNNLYHCREDELSYCDLYCW